MISSHTLREVLDEITSCTGENCGNITKHVNKELRRSACHTNSRSQVCWVTKPPHNTSFHVQIPTQMTASSSAVMRNWSPVPEVTNVSSMPAVQCGLQLGTVLFSQEDVLCFFFFFCVSFVHLTLEKTFI